MTEENPTPLSKDAELSEKQDAVEDVEERLRRTETAYRELSERYGDLEQVLNSEQDRFACEMEATQNAFTEVKGELHRLAEVVKDLEPKLAAKEDEVAALNNKLEAAEGLLQSRNDEMRELEEVNARLASEVDKVGKLKEDVKRARDLEQQCKSLDRELALVRDQLEAEKANGEARFNEVVSSCFFLSFCLKSSFPLLRVSCLYFCFFLFFFPSRTVSSLFFLKVVHFYFLGFFLLSIGYADVLFGYYTKYFAKPSLL
jgi:chromosome segregation ATPase